MTSLPSQSLYLQTLTAIVCKNAPWWWSYEH